MTRPTMKPSPRVWLGIAGALALVAVVLAVAAYFALPGILELPGIRQPPAEATPTPLAPATRVESLTPPGSMQDSSTASLEDSGSGVLPADSSIPDVRNMTFEEAAELVRIAGFLPVEKSVHGPVDSDAGEPGKVYRITPRQGTMAKRGSTVELRTWWESQ